MLSQKRKADGETGMYKAEWKQLYFFGEASGKPICLICREQEQEGAKEDNIREHYNTLHALEYDKYVGKLREEKIACYERFVKKESVFESDHQVSDAANRASYMIAREIAVASKSKSIGNMIKKCMLMTAGAICPDKRQEFADISLSKHAITERIDELSEDVNSQLKDKVKTFVAISVALESANVNLETPLAVFIRGVDKDLEVTEEFVDLIPGNTTSDDIFNNLVEALENIGVDWTHIVCLATGREPSALGVAIKVKEKLVEINPNQHFYPLHSLIHQEMLSNNVLKISNVMDVFQQTVGLLKARLPNQHRLLFCLDTRRGHMGSLLKDFYELRADVLDVTFVQELQDIKWLQDLAFIIDIKEHFDGLNTQVLDQSRYVADFYDSVCAFEMKLELCKSQLSEKNLMHFPILRSLCHENGFLCDTQSKKYVSLISKLQQEFQDAFSDLKNLEKYFKLFQNPFTVNVDEVPVYLQLEVTEIQRDKALKHKFCSVDIKTFYNCIGKSYPGLKSFASIILSMFCTTSVCKKPFYTIFQKNSQRKGTAQKSVLRLATAKAFKPNIDELVVRRKCRKAAAPDSDVVTGNNKPTLKSKKRRADNSSGFGVIEIDLYSSDDECLDRTEHPVYWREMGHYTSDSKEYPNVSEELNWIKKEASLLEEDAFSNVEFIKIKDEPVIL